MPRSIHIPFIPSSLRKLREIAGVTEEEAAKRVRKDVATIRKWESDKHEELPTYAQAKRLSKLYKYDVFMCMKELRADLKPPEVPDFRTLESNGALSSNFSRQLRWLLRQLEIRQDFIRDYGPYWELPHQEWVGSESIGHVNADVLGSKMRALLGISVEEQRSARRIRDAHRSWLNAINDRSGVFVGLTSNQRGSAIELTEMRGLSLADERAPFIVINSKDALAGQIFTMLHEMAHLWLGKAGISGTSGLQAHAARGRGRDSVEAFCDDAAANALLPQDAFSESWSNRASEDLGATVGSLSREYQVSRDAVAVRAAKLELISWRQYSQVRAKFTSDNGTIKSRTGGGGNFYRTHLRNLGEKYARLVIGTWIDREIGIKEAAYYLGITPGSIYSFARSLGALV